MITSHTRTFATLTLRRCLPSLLLAFGLAFGGYAVPARAVEEHPANATHRGIITYELYQIFPENRQGNAVYYNNRLVLTMPNQTIRHVLPLPKEGRFVYLAEDREGKPIVGVYVQHQDGPARATKVTEGFYFVVVVLDGIVYKKIYRVLENKRLMDLLPQSKTADGAVAGQAGVVFYHVATVVERQGENGEPYNEFGIRLHLSLFEDERLRDLDYPVFNTLPRLTLKWADDNQISYTLADGRTEMLSLSQFQ